MHILRTLLTLAALASGLTSALPSTTNTTSAPDIRVQKAASVKTECELDIRDYWAWFFTVYYVDGVGCGDMNEEAQKGLKKAVARPCWISRWEYEVAIATSVSLRVRKWLTCLSFQRQTMAVGSWSLRARLGSVTK
jgi:hypothetical protein